MTVLFSQMQNPESEQKSAPGIYSGRVYFGVRTSKSSKRYMIDFIEAIYWFGTDRGVKYAKYKQVARCGNAVPPPFAEALVRANLPELCQPKEIAA